MMKLMVTLDAKDRVILDILQRDGRIALSELGRRVGLSQPAMSERVKRLEDSGVIVGYGARVNPEALGLGVAAIIRLKTTHEHIRACLKQFADLPHVTDVYRVTGEDCFIIKVAVPTPNDLVGVIDAVGRFGPVTTSVILRSEPVKSIGRVFLPSTKTQTTARPVRRDSS